MLDKNSHHFVHDSSISMEKMKKHRKIVVNIGI